MQMFMCVCEHAILLYQCEAQSLQGIEFLGTGLGTNLATGLDTGLDTSLSTALSINLGTALSTALGTALGYCFVSLVAENLCCSKPRHNEIDEVNLIGKIFFGTALGH